MLEGSGFECGMRMALAYINCVLDVEGESAFALMAHWTRLLSQPLLVDLRENPCNTPSAPFASPLCSCCLAFPNDVE